MGPHRPSRLEFLPIRGLNYAVRQWPAITTTASTPVVFLLHGWMDSSPTFQFVVDHLPLDWHFIAPDWRGYGHSDYLGHPYWFPDYYADLDQLLAHYSPDTPATLVGHSMGANIAAQYAAARPERVRQLIMMDFLGLVPTQTDETPDHLRRWLLEQQQPQRLNSYANHAALAERLQRSNPRLSPERAGFLAQFVSRPRQDGRIEMACDPWHKLANPLRYQTEDALSAWRQIRCPVTHLIADQGYVLARFPLGSEMLKTRLDCFTQGRHHVIENAGHNLQHDQPENVARLIQQTLKTT